jgi:phage baseplate assembly protein W
MYSDISFYPNEKAVEDLEAIMGSIEVLFSFSKGQRLFNPEFGCELEGLLFELMDDSTARIILHELLTCMTRWDPRIRVNPFKSKVTPSYDENRYDLELILEIAGFEGEYTYNGVLNRSIE